YDGIGTPIHGLDNQVCVTELLAADRVASSAETPHAHSPHSPWSVPSPGTPAAPTVHRRSVNQTALVVDDAYVPKQDIRVIFGILKAQRLKFLISGVQYIAFCNIIVKVIFGQGVHRRQPAVGAVLTKIQALYFCGVILHRSTGS